MITITYVNVYVTYVYVTYVNHMRTDVPELP